ncbi:cupin-like domain-containing protein [Calycina marina]|uniref:Cupin-like domain-containing protein n=1 Tax=Calycina marina TaxID=1763456 RepID=A0A9P8CCS8_9HELO|nr:cupin-like domain-containing protein [Calycina marina]
MTKHSEYETIDPTAELITTYNELNSPVIDELTEPPSALEFMRFVAKNRPFVVRGGASNWSAAETWNIATLKKWLKGQDVTVAVTPNGNADAPVMTGDGKIMFVQPLEEQQAFDEFVDFVVGQERTGKKIRDVKEVRYAQTQNDNLRNEYSALYSQVEKDIAWARIALQKSPDAVNLWIGNSLSTTALHKDNYENIYVQILGKKHFVLLPPVAYACVAERHLPSARWMRKPYGRLEITTEEDHSIPFATWDPDNPTPAAEMQTMYSILAQPMRVTLEPGDMLYLPALWYHKVSQSTSDEGICVAANYWYDIEFGGSFWPLCNLARTVGTTALQIEPEDIV